MISYTNTARRWAALLNLAPSRTGTAELSVSMSRRTHPQRIQVTVREVDNRKKRRPTEGVGIFGCRSKLICQVRLPAWLAGSELSATDVASD